MDSKILFHGMKQGTAVPRGWFWRLPGLVLAFIPSEDPFLHIL